MLRTPLHCQFLDRRTRLCTVYPRRRKLNPECLTASEALERRFLPSDCPYAVNWQAQHGSEAYRGPAEWGAGFWSSPGVPEEYARRNHWSPTDLAALREDCRAGRWR